MQAFLRHIRPVPHASVLDLGGTHELWDMVDLPLHVTLLNTPQALAREPDRFGRARVAGDACDLSRYGDHAFDIAFSNGVIEHLGAHVRVERFAAEVRRVAKSYWVQTPCWLFPIEAHTKWPFFWFHPRPVRELLVRWFDRASARDRRPDPVGETTFFTMRTLRALFPDAEVHTERIAGLPKSWSMYRCHDRRNHALA